MLALLSYATGTFSSRQIERSTYESVPVRYLCAGPHPDHDSICTFRVQYGELLAKNFHQVLELAVRAAVLKVGNITLAVDGTKIRANASKHGAMSHGHALEQMRLLEEEIASLLTRAADADSAPLGDGRSIPAEPERSGDSQPQAARRASAARQIERRTDRLEKLKEAAAVMRERAKERHALEQASI